MRERGKSFEAPDWWLKLARARLGGVKGLAELGKELARIAGRPVPWNHSVLSNFVNGKIQPTVEMALALSDFLAIPRPLYVPRDEREATAMQAVAAMSGLVSTTEPKSANQRRAERAAKLDQELESMEAEIDRHTTRLQSRDEVRGTRRGGPGGVR